MKGAVLFLVGLYSTFLSFEARGGTIAPNFLVVSDEFNGAIPKGKCLVVGHVYSRHTDENGKNIPVANGNVATLDREKSYYTDLKGQYKLLLDVDDSSIFFYDPMWEEIVIWSYDFKSQRVVTIDFYPDVNESQKAVLKPVIYLYSDTEIDAEIVLSCKGDLTFTYPEYIDKWSVTVNQNQLSENKTKKNYPYLFWEGKNDNLNFVVENNSISGFILSTDTIVNFLENSLTKLGLNEKEQTDFITFWGPRLNVKQFVLIQYLIDDEYTKLVSEIAISPKPDAMRRVFILFQPLDKFETGFTIDQQELFSFEREGFTVLEWGGSEMKNTNLIP